MKKIHSNCLKKWVKKYGPATLIIICINVMLFTGINYKNFIKEQKINHKISSLQIKAIKARHDIKKIDALIEEIKLYSAQKVHPIKTLSQMAKRYDFSLVKLGYETQPSKILFIISGGFIHFQQLMHALIASKFPYKIKKIHMEATQNLLITIHFFQKIA